MQALVTGASGFTGKYLVEFLQSCGCKIHTLGREKLPGIPHSQLTLNLQKIHEVIKEVRPDYLFHLAGCVVSEALSEFFNVNVMFAAYLLEALDLEGLSKHTRILIVGSAAEYGWVPKSSLPISEKTSPVPNNLYGISKLAQTQMALKWAHPDRKLVVVRPFTIVGPGIPDRMAIGSFIKQMRAIRSQGGKGKIVMGNIAIQRDFLSIKDAMHMYWKLLHAEEAFGKIVNVCSGKPASLQSIFSYLIEKSHYEVHIQQSSELMRSVDMETHYGDNRLLYELLGDMELTSLEESLDLIMEDL